MRPTDERSDLALLLAAGGLVPAGWLALGWRWPLGLAVHDELAQNLLLIREVAAGGWEALRYRPDLLGGFAGRDVLGAFPLFPLFARLGLGPVAISTLSTFVVQGLLGFLLARAGCDLARALRGRPGWPVRIAAIVLGAFAPALGWRLGMGHLNLVSGLLAFAAALALLPAAAAGTLTVTLTTVAAAAIALALSYAGQQMVVYGAILGGPVLLGLWLSLRAPVRRLLPALLVAVSGLLLALPAFVPMLVHARGSDAARQLGHEVVTYDFGAARPADWAASLPWSRPIGEAGALHETNYPIGPLLLLLALLPWRRLRALAAGLAAAVIAALLLSLDVAPLSRWLIAALPPLAAFRVPARAALPLLTLLPVLSVAALASLAPPPEAAPVTGRRHRKGEPPPSPGPSLAWLAVPAILLLALLPSLPHEVALWGLALLVVVAAGRIPAGAALLVLGAGSLLAFGERLQPFPDPAAPLAEAARIGAALRQARPELGSPLVRIRLGLSVPVLGPNTAFAAGLSSLDGYQAPLRRFSQLVFALRGQPHQPTAVLFVSGRGDPAFDVLRQLHDVRWDASLEAAGRLRVAELGPTAGPAWFSAALERVPGLPALVEQLKQPGLHERAHQFAWLVASDPLNAGLPERVDPACASARLDHLEAAALPLRALVETPANCPLTFAMNFAEDLQATAQVSGAVRTLPVFPAYGALAGVVVPHGATEVRIGLRPDPRWPLAGPPLGLALLAAVALAERRRNAAIGS
jgi:hypothetical protein